MSLTKEQFLSRKPKTDTITLTSGENLSVRPMNERERTEYEIGFLDADGKVQIEKLFEARRVLVQKCVVDENGKQMFSADEINELEELDAAFVGEIHDQLRVLNGLDKKDQGVKDARKN